jgi:hypothetical protein
MLLAGLLLANVPRSPAAGLPPDWGSQIRAAGLATIYLRCGLVLEWKVGQVGGSTLGGADYVTASLVPPPA